MSGVVGVKVDGADQLARTLRRAGAQLADWTAVNTRAAEVLADAARRAVPRRTGRLAGTIRTRAGKAEAEVTAGGGGVVYAKVQEYGSPRRNIRAQPYMRPAVDQSAGEIPRLYAGHVTATISHVKGA